MPCWRAPPTTSFCIARRCMKKPEIFITGTLRSFPSSLRSRDLNGVPVSTSIRCHPKTLPNLCGTPSFKKGWRPCSTRERQHFFDPGLQSLTRQPYHRGMIIQLSHPQRQVEIKGPKRSKDVLRELN